MEIIKEWEKGKNHRKGKKEENQSLIFKKRKERCGHDAQEGKKIVRVLGVSHKTDSHSHHQQECWLFKHAGSASQTIAW